MFTEVAVRFHTALQCERTLAFPDGEVILFIEQYFLVRVADGSINLDNLIEYEQEVFRGYHWWALSDMRKSEDLFVPEGFADLVAPILQEIPVT